MSREWDSAGVNVRTIYPKNVRDKYGRNGSGKTTKLSLVWQGIILSKLRVTLYYHCYGTATPISWDSEMETVLQDAYSENPGGNRE